MNTEVIFWDQLKHQRTISNTISKGRRKWKATMYWYPAEQVCLHTRVDKIYAEARKKYGEKLFRVLVKEMKLNERVFDPMEDRVRLGLGRWEEAELKGEELKIVCPPIGKMKPGVYKKHRHAPPDM